jgi:hypothetical protein
MVKIKVNGTEYVLRFDMSVSEWIEENYGDLREALKEIRTPSKTKEIMTAIFTSMANAGADYLHAGVIYKADDIKLFDKHTSPGRIAVIRRAIEEAVRDGSRMQVTEEDEDNSVRDDYLEEVKRAEAEKN